MFDTRSTQKYPTVERRNATQLPSWKNNETKNGEKEKRDIGDSRQKKIVFFSSFLYFDLRVKKKRLSLLKQNEEWTNIFTKVKKDSSKQVF